MPGCPPESHQIAAVVDLIVKALHGEATLPPPGSTIGAGGSTVCDECPRARNVKTIKKFVRIQDMRADPSLCLLEQGIPCNGLATRSDCGARLMTAFASVIDSKDPVEIERILDGIPDPAGQFYRFNLAKSLLRAAKPAWAVNSDQ